MALIVRIPAQDRAASVARNVSTFSSEAAAAEHYEPGDLFLEIFEDDQAEDVTASIEAIVEQQAEWDREWREHVAIERSRLRVA